MTARGTHNTEAWAVLFLVSERRVMSGKGLRPDICRNPARLGSRLCSYGYVIPRKFRVFQYQTLSFNII